jgi:hypothetical protein
MEFRTCYHMLATLLPNRQRFTYVERLIHSDQIDMRTQLRCIAGIHVPYLKRVDLAHWYFCSPAPLPPQLQTDMIHHNVLEVKINL